MEPVKDDLYGMIDTGTLSSIDRNINEPLGPSLINEMKRLVSCEFA